MNLTYTWSLERFKKRNTSELNNIIVQTYWSKTGTDENGNSATFMGATPFDISSVDPNNFVPYEDLTEEIILSWIQSIDYDHVNMTIERMIMEKLNPEITSEFFPWNVGISTTP
tara:strand:+ start:3029 stop:3370 length:342 start_codon:yes stop_codon:yes gene_type:complete